MSQKIDSFTCFQERKKKHQIGVDATVIRQ